MRARCCDGGGAINDIQLYNGCRYTAITGVDDIHAEWMWSLCATYLAFYDRMSPAKLGPKICRGYVALTDVGKHAALKDSHIRAVAVIHSCSLFKTNCESHFKRTSSISSMSLPLNIAIILSLGCRHTM